MFYLEDHEFSEQQKLSFKVHADACTRPDRDAFCTGSHFRVLLLFLSVFTADLNEVRL